MTKLSIIVPTYNEAENLQILVTRIHKALSHIDYEIVVVDDNSPDGTGELAETLSQTFPIKTIHRTGKLGLASAVIDGFGQAEGEVLGVIDADLQHPPEKVPELLERIEGADIVVASRYIDGGGMEEWSLTRKIISQGARKMPHFLFARIRSVSDPLSGFFLFRKEVIEGVTLEPVGYKILLEILIRGNHNSVAEVPYIFVGRERGESNLTLTEEVNYLKHLWRLIRAEGEEGRFIKFCVVGLTGVAVNLGLLAIFKEAIGIHYILAAIIAIEASIINNFIWNEHWTFRDRQTGTKRSKLSRLAKFNLISLIGLSINMVILIFLTEMLDVYYMASELFGIIAATSFNFIFNKWLTWE